MYFVTASSRSLPPHAASCSAIAAQVIHRSAPRSSAHALNTGDAPVSVPEQELDKSLVRCEPFGTRPAAPGESFLLQLRLHDKCAEASRGRSHRLRAENLGSTRRTEQLEAAATSRDGPCLPLLRIAREDRVGTEHHEVERSEEPPPLIAGERTWSERWELRARGRPREGRQVRDAAQT